MFVYNISIKINPAIEGEWLQWQHQEHIPEVMSSGMFTEFKFYRLLEPQQEGELVYIIQYFATTLENYHRYNDQIAPGLRKKAFDKWGDQFMAFRTLMQVVN